MAFIELSYGPTQFRSTLVKLYYTPIIETDQNLNKDIEDTLFEITDNAKYQDVLLTHLFPDILPIFIPSIPLVSLTYTSIFFSIIFILVKRKYRRPQKYLIQTNLLILLNIYFVIDNLYNDFINMRLFLYILLR